jgi:antitoxin Phd
MSKASWQLQEAKAQLSEVVKRAEREGPQEITVHGTPTAVILSSRDYAKLVKRRPGLVELISRSPLKGVELDLTRDRRVPRDVDL